MSSIERARGLTLIELIIFIVVVSAAVAGVLAVFAQTTRASSDPLIRKQAVAVAESLMEEIMAVPYACPDASCVAVTTANRGATHAVADYNGFAMTGISAVDGAPIPSLAGYNAAVTVAALALNGAVGSRITITVAAGAESIVLEGWRGNY